MLTLTLVAVAVLWLVAMAVVVTICMSAAAGDRALQRTVASPLRPRRRARVTGHLRSVA